MGGSFQESYEYAKSNGYGELWLALFHKHFPDYE